MSSAWFARKQKQEDRQVVTTATGTPIMDSAGKFGLRNILSVGLPPGIEIRHQPGGHLEEVVGRHSVDAALVRLAGRGLTIRALNTYPKSGLLVFVSLAGACKAKRDSFATVIGPGEYMLSELKRPVELDMHGTFEAVMMSLPNAWFARKIDFKDSRRIQVSGSNSTLAPVVVGYLQTLAGILPSLEDPTFAKLIKLAASLVILSAKEATRQAAIDRSGRVASLARIKTCVQDKLVSADLSPAKIAAEAGVSVRHLHALFSREGTTFSNWIWAERLEVCRAKLCLKESAHRTIGQLAIECGFKNSSHFSRRFRAAYGISAREFRRTALVSETAQVRFSRT